MFSQEKIAALEVENRELQLSKEMGGAVRKHRGKVCHTYTIYIYIYSHMPTGHAKHATYICYVNTGQVYRIQGSTINNPLVLKTMCVYVCIHIH